MKPNIVLFFVALFSAARAQAEEAKPIWLAVGRPGLVATTSGALVDVRESGETTLKAEDGKAIIEDENTVHWLCNPGDKTATAILCDLRPPLFRPKKKE